MQKESSLFFSFSSESIFDEVKDTNKREKMHFPSESIFDEVKDRYTSNSNEMVSLNSSIACGNLGQFSREKIATKFICPSILPSAVCI